MKMDIEKIFDDIVTLVREQLNTEIELINAEKDDTLKLETITDKAHFFSSLPQAAFNYTHFLVFSFSNNPTVESQQGDNNIKAINLTFEVVAQDKGQSYDRNLIKRLMRYSTALENIFLKNQGRVMQGYGKLEVTALVPSGLFAVDGKYIRSAGVSVTARITAR